MEFVQMDWIGDRYYIRLNDEAVGIVEYTEYDDELEIKYIKIYEEYRRMGIATMAVKALMNKQKKIIGDSLPEALDFWRSVNAYFYEPFDNYDTVLTPFKIEI